MGREVLDVVSEDSDGDIALQVRRSLEFRARWCRGLLVMRSFVHETKSKSA